VLTYRNTTYGFSWRVVVLNSANTKASVFWGKSDGTWEVADFSHPNGMGTLCKYSRGWPNYPHILWGWFDLPQNAKVGWPNNPLAFSQFFIYLFHLFFCFLNNNNNNIFKGIFFISFFW